MLNIEYVSRLKDNSIVSCEKRSISIIIISITSIIRDNFKCNDEHFLIPSMLVNNILNLSELE